MSVAEDPVGIDEGAFWARAGDVAPWAALARALARDADALRVTLALDRDDEQPVIVECGATGPVAVAIGELALELPEARLDAAEPPLEPPEVAPPASLAVDPERAEIVAPMGTVARLALAVRAVGEALEGRGVATAQWATGDPQAPLTIAVRRGEAVVIGIGEELFTMGDGWPGGT